MTYQEFWEMSPELVLSYQEAERLRTEKQNTFMWLQGKYIYDAHMTALANFSAGLAGKKGKEKYTEKPYRVTPMSEEEKEAERKRKLEAYIESLKAFQTAFNRRKEKNNAG